MRDREVICVGFQKDYSMLTTKFQKSQPGLYNLGVLIAYGSELNKGYGVKRQLKTTYKGTKFNFEPLDTKEKLDTYKEKIKELQSNFDVELTVKQVVERIKEVAEKECQK